MLFVFTNNRMHRLKLFFRQLLRSFAIQLVLFKTIAWKLQLLCSQAIPCFFLFPFCLQLLSDNFFAIFAFDFFSIYFPLYHTIACIFLVLAIYSTNSCRMMFFSYFQKSASFAVASFNLSLESSSSFYLLNQIIKSVSENSFTTSDAAAFAAPTFFRSRIIGLNLLRRVFTFDLT